MISLILSGIGLIFVLIWLIDSNNDFTSLNQDCNSFIEDLQESNKIKDQYELEAEKEVEELLNDRIPLTRFR